MTELPAHAQWVLRPLTEIEMADDIESEIDFVDKNGRSVRLPMDYVRHFMRQNDNLPRLMTVSVLPIVLADGPILAMHDGLERERGIVFKIPKELIEMLPERGGCDDDAVGKAMRFLTDEWLCDVATDYTGKCTLIAAALTMIERSILDQRPVFFVSAGQRGSGKTTTLTMLIEAVMGIAPAAAAWSPNEEERRKSVFSYFKYGLTYILWDNIPRGTQISCPHIEKSCTAAYYADRNLGVSEIQCVAASTIHLFTGNNIGPKGDLASRSLQVRLDVDRVDPENRDFRHPDRVGWTRANRAEILTALYMVLLGNPALDLPQAAPMKTRFKMWYRVVGSAVEHAAKCAGAGVEVDYGKLFLDQEADDEDATSLAEMLAALSEGMQSRDAAVGRKPQPSKATDVADAINGNPGDANMLIVRGFLFPNQPSTVPVTAKAVGKRLKAHVGAPTRHGGQTLVLKSYVDSHDQVLKFRVETIR
jgi:hypothetical protein